MKKAGFIIFYAIRNTSAKGVYDNKELFERLKKENKGCSCRSFEVLEDALKWAEVKNLGNAPQQVVNVGKKDAQSKENQNKLSKLIGYVNDGKLMEIKMDNGNVYTLTLKSHAYITNHIYGGSIDYKFPQESLIDYYNKYLKNKEMNKRDMSYYEEILRGYRVDYLPKTNIEFLDEDFVRISNYDLKCPVVRVREVEGKYKHFKHAEYLHEKTGSIILNTNKIAEVMTYGCWTLNGRGDFEEGVLKFIEGK